MFACNASLEVASLLLRKRLRFGAKGQARRQAGGFLGALVLLLSKLGQVVLGPSLAGNRPKLKCSFRLQYGVPFKGMGVGGDIGPERLPNFGGTLHEAYANASTRSTMKASEGELDESGNVSDGLELALRVFELPLQVCIVTD